MLISIARVDGVGVDALARTALCVSYENKLVHCPLRGEVPAASVASRRHGARDGATPARAWVACMARDGLRCFVLR